MCRGAVREGNAQAFSGGARKKRKDASHSLLNKIKRGEGAAEISSASGWFTKEHLYREGGRNEQQHEQDDLGRKQNNQGAPCREKNTEDKEAEKTPRRDRGTEKPSEGREPSPTA